MQICKYRKCYIKIPSKLEDGIILLEKTQKATYVTLTKLTTNFTISIYLNVMTL